MAKNMSSSDMTNMELPLHVGGRKLTAFLQQGFFQYDRVSTTPHRHGNTEIHLQIAGEIVFDVQGKRITLRKDEILCVPPKTFHRAVKISHDSAHLYFQISEPVRKDSVQSLPEGSAAQIRTQAQICACGGDAGLLSAWLSLLCAQLDTLETACRPVPTQDREYLIREFFAKNYHLPVTVSDLSKILCVCDKQTQRLVRNVTGNTFTQELVRCRMEAAIELIAGGVSKEEAAKLVGYLSYGGFFKAYKRMTSEK